MHFAEAIGSVPVLRSLRHLNSAVLSADRRLPFVPVRIASQPAIVKVRIFCGIGRSFALNKRPAAPYYQLCERFHILCQQAGRQPDQVRPESHRSPGKGRSMSRFGFLAALAAAAFGVTYLAVKLIQGGGDSPSPGMIWIAGGEFSMGTDSDIGWPDEKPAHRVRVDGF
jgi:hypothetical protein